MKSSEEQATIEQIAAAARRSGYTIASAALAVIDRTKGRLTEDAADIVNAAIKSGLSSSFAVALAEPLSPEELDAWSGGLVLGANTALADMYAPYLSQISLS